MSLIWVYWIQVHYNEYHSCQTNLTHTHYKRNVYCKINLVWVGLGSSPLRSTTALLPGSGFVRGAGCNGCADWLSRSRPISLLSVSCRHHLLPFAPGGLWLNDPYQTRPGRHGAPTARPCYVMCFSRLSDSSVLHEVLRFNCRGFPMIKRIQPIQPIQSNCHFFIVSPADWTWAREPISASVTRVWPAEAPVGVNGTILINIYIKNGKTNGTNK